jgi:hypothetical protein
MPKWYNNTEISSRFISAQLSKVSRSHTLKAWKGTLSAWKNCSLCTDYYTTQYTQATAWLKSCLFAVVSPDFLCHIFGKVALLSVRIRYKDNILLRPPWRPTKERKGTAALIVPLSAGCRWMVAFTSCPLYSGGKNLSISTEWEDFYFRLI